MALKPYLQWYIDAWLPVEGVAFISQRAPRPDIWSARSGDDDMGATFLLQAPAFDLVPVERSLAFGAVHRGAQEGFSLDGEDEYGFETDADLREFVRRIFAGSGPGTTGGGGAPEPEPWQPEGPVTADVWRPLWSTVDDQPARQEQRTDWPPGPDLAELRRTMHAAATMEIRAQASGLLIESAFAVFSAVDGPAARSPARDLLRAARYIAPSYSDFEQLLYRLQPDMHNTYFLDWHRARMHSFDALRHCRLPRAWVRRLKLPPRVQTWLDAMAFLAAERGYVTSSTLQAWLPLAVALAAPIATFREGAWSDYERDDRDELARSSIELAASWIALRGLPAALENNIREWCWRREPAARDDVNNGSAR